MAQQLDLNDPRFTPQRLRFSARQGLFCIVLVLALGQGGGQALRWLAGQRSAAARHLDADLAPLRSALAALGASAAGGRARPGTATAGGTSAAAEIEQLQALDNAQRRIFGVLDSGVTGHREGHAGYLLALARRASGALWITGFTVSDDGSEISLEGRMNDAAALPDYLRRLNAEPRFKGRPFAQLSLKAVDGGADPGSTAAFTEFSLRSTAMPAKAMP